MPDDHTTVDVLVIGAGAAGLATAIFLARRRPGLRVVACDGAPRIGAKILVSGGGRCNVTNARVTPADFYGGNPNVLRRAFAAFSETQVRGFFDEIGVPLHEEEFGKLFPDSNQARTVVAALLAEADRRGAQIRTGHRVTAVAPDPAGGFRATIAVGPPAERRDETWHARRVVLATGGLSLPKTGSDGFGYQLARQLGHTLVPTTPGLDPLVLAGSLHAGLSGVAHDVEITIRVEGRKPALVTGPMLWTHFGISGPAALNAARFWNRAQIERRPVAVTANLLPGETRESAERAWLDFATQQPRAAPLTLLRRWLPARVAEAVIAETAGAAAVKEIAQIPRETRRRILATLLAWPLPVVRTRGYNYAEVTAGGVPLSEINPATMESRPCPGLHLVGEILDVDGRIGGFNFQWAWSSAWLAAEALSRQ